MTVTADGIWPLARSRGTHLLDDVSGVEDCVADWTDDLHSCCLCGYLQARSKAAERTWGRTGGHGRGGSWVRKMVRQRKKLQVRKAGGKGEELSSRPPRNEKWQKKDIHEVSSWVHASNNTKQSGRWQMDTGCVTQRLARSLNPNVEIGL